MDDESALDAGSLEDGLGLAGVGGGAEEDERQNGSA
jgi:hypothetical protein